MIADRAAQLQGLLHDDGIEATLDECIELLVLDLLASCTNH